MRRLRIQITLTQWVSKGGNELQRQRRHRGNTGVQNYHGLGLAFFIGEGGHRSNLCYAYKQKINIYIANIG